MSLLQVSKRSELDWTGKMDGNIKVIFPGMKGFKDGDYVIVRVIALSFLEIKKAKSYS